MKKKLLLITIMLALVFTLTGCFDNSEEEKNDNALKFKQDYEEINGTQNSKGKEHRTVTIDSNNRFIEISAEEAVQMIKDKRSFYIYFGSRLCPWCRSTIEMADQVSRDNDIAKIYYVDIWDDEGNEILRDKYQLKEDNSLELVYEGTESYKELIKALDILLEDYTLTDSDGNIIEVGEKRIYAPNYVYIKDGVAERLVTGISKLQKDSREELTEEMLKEEESIFLDFFANMCDDKC